MPFSMLVPIGLGFISGLLTFPLLVRVYTSTTGAVMMCGSVTVNSVLRTPELLFRVTECSNDGGKTYQPLPFPI
jgi:hypothetical protein